MEAGAQDWMTAAACAEGPRPRVTFADLPPQHQEELVRLALVAAAATAYFVTLVLLSNPLPSRSLAARAALPDPTGTRPIVLEARLERATVDVVPARPRTSRPRPAVGLADLREPVVSTPATSSAPRRNPFSRFLRGVLHAVAPD
jgi:hypothetical protein